MCQYTTSIVWPSTLPTLIRPSMKKQSSYSKEFEAQIQLVQYTLCCKNRVHTNIKAQNPWNLGII